VTVLTATIKPLRDAANLEASWRTLEALHPRPFFLSWEWTATAIEAARDDLYVVEISADDGRLAGLGLLCPITEVRHKFIRIRQLRLNEVGENAAQTVPVEYNNFLIAPGDDDAAWDAVLTALEQPGAPPWDEIIVANALVPTEEKVIAHGKLVHRRAESTSGFVDLGACRKGGGADLGGYLATLGRNTRSQIKRSIRLYEEYDPVTMTRATTLHEAKSYFASLAQLHETKWRARGKSGVLSNEYLWKFHTNLIERCFDSGKVELLCAAAGGEPFGWLYNFVDRGRVLFNLSGFKTETDNRYKPGLVTQALAIEAHLKGGMEVYDFMAGTDRYKLNLGERGPDIVTFAIQRKRPVIIAENAARRVKTKILAALGANRRSKLTTGD